MAFMLEHERKRGDRYMDDWLCEWAEWLRRYMVVVFVHVKSHTGVPLNEVADVLAKAARDLERVGEQRVEPGPRKHVELMFRGGWLRGRRG